jgi:hypothetical protein
VAHDEIVLGTEVEPIETIVALQDEAAATNGHEQMTPAYAGV